jgi:hypothetical protein
MLPDAPIEPEGTFAGLSGPAILLGAFVDIASSVIAMTLLVLWMAPDLASQDDAHTRQALADLHDSSRYVAANVALGALCTVLGAFVGARRAGQLHVRHGGWIAVTGNSIGLLLSALSGPSSDGEFSFHVQVISWLLILPAGVAGGALAAALSATHEKDS